jgi:hypothetical protein
MRSLSSSRIWLWRSAADMTLRSHQRPRPGGRKTPHRGRASRHLDRWFSRTAPSGPISRCGNRGCLETVASPVAVAALLELSAGEPVSVQRLLECFIRGAHGCSRCQGEGRLGEQLAAGGQCLGAQAATLREVRRLHVTHVGSPQDDELDLAGVARDV